MITEPQSAAPAEYETATIVAQEWRQLGLNVKVRVMPWSQMSQVVWFQRQNWDTTMWQMVARPERSDPDEFTVNLFDSATAAKGYNFEGYNSPAYDSVAFAQRAAINAKNRAQLVDQAQMMVAKAVPYAFLVYPKITYAFNNKVWDPSTVVDAAGLGIKNFWTFLRATPLGSQKNMILNTAATITAINPLYISGAADSWITELIWDRLARVGPDGLPHPWAATSMTWQDPTHMLVKLRQGMKWQDGQPVTRDDVIFSFQMAGSKMAPQYQPFASDIKSITKTGTTGLLFTLNKPYTAFETASLAKINIIPKHIWQPIIQKLKAKGLNAQQYQSKHPIGSGPFEFVSWQKNQEVVLKANPNYFDPAKMNEWILRIVPNTASALGMIQNGQLNFLSDYTGDMQLLAQAVKSHPDLTMSSDTGIGFRFISFNERRPPFNNVAFRRALTAVINQKEIVQVVWHGYATPAMSVISPALKWHDSNASLASVYPHGGVAAAKKILAAAGFAWDAKGHLLYPKGQTEKLKTAP